MPLPVPGGARLLALEERIRRPVGGQVELGRRLPCKHSEQTDLVGRAHIDRDVGRAQEVLDVHASRFQYFSPAPAGGSLSSSPS